MAKVPAVVSVKKEDPVKPEVSATPEKVADTQEATISNGSSELTPTDEESVSVIKPNYGDGSPPDWLWVEEGKALVDVEIYAYKDPVSGKLKAVSQDPSTPLRAVSLIEYPIKSQWTIPTKVQLDSYRERSKTIDRTLLRTLVDRFQVQEYVIRYHLMDLKIHHPAESGKEPSLILLKRDKRGRLTDETLDMVKRIHPTVLELLWAKFMEEASLIL
jgi:hypothetical protein